MSCLAFQLSAVFKCAGYDERGFPCPETFPTFVEVEQTGQDITRLEVMDVVRPPEASGWWVSSCNPPTHAFCPAHVKQARLP